MYKLKDWVHIDKMDWYILSRNPNVIHLLENNMDKIDWNGLSNNPNAMQLLEKNMDKIDWYALFLNPSIFELDYEALEKRCNIYKEELMKKALHPFIIILYLNHPDFQDKDLEYILDHYI